MVTFGVRLRDLSRMRVGLAASLVLACLAALSSLFSVSLFPPGLSARGPQAAGAHTQILVSDRRVSVLDAGFDVKTFNELHDGTALAGTLIVRDPIRAYIAGQAQIPLTAIAFDDPQYPINPPVPARRTSRYSVTVAARPTVPILDVYAQAPTTAAARRLADVSAAGLSKYLATSGGFGLRATQIGDGADVRVGAGPTVTRALAIFAAAFAVCCGAMLVVDRARRTARAQHGTEPVSA